VASGETTIEAAVFDWDGTLIDSRAALLAAWRESTRLVLGRVYPATPEEEDVVFTLPGARIWPQLASGQSEVAALSERFQEAYERHAAKVSAFPAVRAMLDALRAAGVAVGVVTSKARRRFEPDAKHAGLADAIDVAVCAEDARASKPDPEPVLLALRKLGIEPRLALMVGDTAVDVNAGIAAGARAIGVGWGHGSEDVLLAAGAVAVARHPDELTTLALGARRCATTGERA
jgi:HAD superfamily hydrolase (TIGR01509 family)